MRSQAGLEVGGLLRRGGSTRTVTWHPLQENSLGWNHNLSDLLYNVLKGTKQRHEKPQVRSEKNPIAMFFSSMGGSFGKSLLAKINRFQ